MNWTGNTEAPPWAARPKFPRSKADLALLLQQARNDAFQEGVLRGQRLAEEKQPARDAAIRLINAVGQTLNTQASLVQGLAATLDNMPR